MCVGRFLWEECGVVLSGFVLFFFSFPHWLSVQFMNPFFCRFPPSLSLSLCIDSTFRLPLLRGVISSLSVVHPYYCRVLFSPFFVLSSMEPRAWSLLPIHPPPVCVCGVCKGRVDGALGSFYESIPVVVRISIPGRKQKQKPKIFQSLCNFLRTHARTHTQAGWFDFAVSLACVCFQNNTRTRSHHTASLKEHGSDFVQRAATKRGPA